MSYDHEFPRSKQLAAQLRARIQGEVRFDAGSRALYATDGSNYRQVPIGVVVPRDASDIIETVSLCRHNDAPILSRGGGTSLAGQCCNVAVVMDMSKYYNRVLEIDTKKRLARVEPGTVLDEMQKETRKHGLFFPPDPATHNHCTLGGMIGNNSCGIHSIMAGRTSDNVEELEVLTYDGVRMRVGKTEEDELERVIRLGGRRGEIYAALRALRNKYADLIREKYPKIPRRVSGYNLNELLPENGFHVARALVGTESTCVTVLEATVRLTPEPKARSLLVLGYADVYSAADHVPEIMEFSPIGLEGLDDRLVGDTKKKNLHPDAIQYLPKGAGWLVVEFGGESKADSEKQALKAMAALKTLSGAPDMKLFDDQEEEKKVWEVRELGLGATAMIPGEKPTWEGWEDSAVPPENLGRYLRALRGLLDKYGYKGDLYGHFGQGCVHTRIDFDLFTHEGVKKYRSFIDDAADLVVGLGGSFSGEHGDGQSRAALLPKMFGPELVRAFREFKSIWDPQGRMNPGKIVDAYQPDENLRLGTDYHPRPRKTHFQFPEDEGSFAHAALRCVGVGKCRRMEGGVMCPSYRVTREEKHSTRGRAHLLFEMLQGEVIGKRGWREKSVKEALDLCLSCKGCKSDCPVNVDMATYKAEFLSHYYARRLRPRSAYSMGLIPWWARLASHMPRLANGVSHAPGLGAMVKLLAGIDSHRDAPSFARKTFRDGFRARNGAARPEARVLLWPDTFTNYFHPEVGEAALEVLGAAGFQVGLPPAGLCCGRPLYDYGMLRLAKRWLKKILHVLRDDIAAGVPLVVLEPSCAAVFRDELVNMLPQDQDARRLSQQTFLLGEFLQKRADGLELPKLGRKAIVQAHCHHRAIMGVEGEEALLSQLGLDFEILESGCCGMAGSFGFESGEHYEVSEKAGERVLLPAVRRAGPDTLIIADGFSCREQIRQATGRRALHLAQVLSLAAREGGISV